MSTDRQKSFTGTLSVKGIPITIRTFSDGSRGTRSLLIASPGAIPTQFYFRVEGGSYVMYVRSGNLIGQLVNLSRHDEIVVSPRDRAGEIQFDLGGMSLDIMETDTINLWIDLHHNQRMGIDKRRGLNGGETSFTVNSLRYLRSSKPTNFTLHILQRNAPYLSHPDEF